MKTLFSSTAKYLFISLFINLYFFLGGGGGAFIFYLWHFYVILTL